MSRHDKNKGNVAALVFETKSYIGDETPTPTGLIRVGEELGLFDDLQKVNLFEESFRKRVELGPNHQVKSKVNASKGDDLLTPTIFTTNTDSVSDLSMGTVEVSDRLMTQDSLLEAECNQSFGMKENSMTDSDMSDVSSTKTVTSVQLMDNSFNVISSRSYSVMTVISNPLEDAKSKLKSSIMSKSSGKNLVNAFKAKPIFEDKERSRTRTSTHSSSDEVDKETMLKRERNRVAAMRSRKKRKTWVEQLEKSAGAMQMLNTKLQTEVTCLRAEVAQLKTLLLAHKDCPVTRAMTQVDPDPPKESHSVHVIEHLIPDHFLARTEQTNISEIKQKENNSKLRVLLQQKLNKSKASKEMTPEITVADSVQQLQQTQSIVVVVKSPNSSEPIKKMTISNCDLDQFIPVIKCNPNVVQTENKSGCESFLSKTLPKTKALS